MKTFDRWSVRGTILGHRLSSLMAVLAFAMLVRPALASGPDSPVAVEVLEDGDRIVLRYSFGDYRSETVTIGGEEYQKLRFAGEAVTLEAGAPAAPKVCRSVITPGAEMAVRVLAADYHELPGKLAPSKGSLLRTVNPADVPHTFGEVYQTDAFYPPELAQLGAQYILRDYHGAVVQVYPVRYNPVTGVLRVYTSVTVEVAPVGPTPPAVLQRGPAPGKALSLAFHKLYSHHFENYSAPYAPLDEEGDMLIIVYDPWVPNVEPLAAHKNGSGIDTTVVKVSTAGGSASAIKSYIQSVYDSSDLAFVLLVGDAAQVPPLYASGGASDPSYAKLAGGDDYPEIMIGRLSAENAAQVDTQVQRTIEYELMPATMEDWFWKGMGIASNQGPGDDGELDYQHLDNIRDLLLAYGYTEVDQIYDPYGTAAMVSSGLNAGRGIINYTGHGWQQGWGTTGFDNSDVDALVNDNMLPFITSVACNTGEFDSTTCFGEAWLRATHAGEPAGAIGFYGSSISQYWDEPMQMQDEYTDLYVAEQYVMWGTLCYAGSCSMMDQYGATGVDMFDTWILFGDPSLRVVGTVGPPHGLRVTPSGGFYSEGQQGGPFTPESIDYTLENFNDTPIDYEVTKTQEWVTITSGSGTVPPLSTTVVTVSINSAADLLANGQYEDTVSFVNLTDHDGDTTRAVTLKVGVPTVLHEFVFDSDPGWTTQGQWEFGDPTGQGGYSHGYPDPNNGFTGANVYGVNLNGDYSTAPGGPYYVTLGPLDLTDIIDVSLKFQRWLNTDYQPYVYATTDVSNSGTSWTEIFSNGSTEMTASSWSLQEYDISAIADDQATVYIRWGYQIGSGAWAYSGWNIDDVQIWGLDTSGFPLGDLNCDGLVNAFDIDPFVLAITDPAGYEAAYPACDIMLGDINGDGAVDSFDIDPFVDLLTW